MRRAALIALCLLPALPAAAKPELSRNADLLVPGHASAAWRPGNAAQEPTREPSLPVVDMPVFHGHHAVATVRLGSDMRGDFCPLSPWVAENMTDESARDFAQGCAALAVPFTKAGISVAYDEAEAVLRLSADPARARPRAVELSYAPLSTAQEVITPAPLSGFINFRSGVDYVQDDTTISEGRQPAVVDIDGAVNFHGTVLESRVEYLEDDARPWRRGDTRLVRDFPDVMVRAAAGDLSYPIFGFQSYRQMAGISIARNFDLQPYRVTAPAGGTSFTLQSPSRVEVIVNGQRVRTLQLGAGTYDITDFPVAEGSNDVTLEITDAAGRMETRRLSLISDQRLLKAGLHEYAYNAGVEYDDAGRRREYHVDRPGFSAFHRYGFSDATTAGISAQGDDRAQMASLSALHAIDSIGLAGIEVAGSRAEGEGGAAAELFFRRQNSETRRDFSAEATWRSENFAAMGDANPSNPFALDLTGRYTQPVFWGAMMGVGGRYRFGRNGREDEWSASATFSKSVLSFSGNLTLEQRSDDGFGAFISATWMPSRPRHSISAAVDTRARTQEILWSYRAARSVRSVNASLGVVRGEDGERATGSASYVGYRGEVSARHETVFNDDDDTRQRSSLRAGTAIAFAGGRVAVTRPVTGSFVLLAAHKNLGGTTIGINPEAVTSAKGHYQAEINGLGPAVLPDIAPYLYRPVRIDTRNLPPGYEIDRDLYAALPGYKSGALVEVGSAANVTLDGRLTRGDEAAVLQSGTAVCEGVAPQEFFTNGEGRFRIGRLSPGDCRLILLDGSAARVRIPDVGAGVFDAGEVPLERSER